ncbi:hypothetical protein [Campylobacter fetus]|uniref:hypothetical protein n=1 Tax=Campylobacter fetus TaxID=196 RepID=UPI00112F9318|nr:hypothetical protein [Campylobacter fetus]
MTILLHISLYGFHLYFLGSSQIKEVMLKIFLAFLVLAGIASATEVTVCQFKNGLGYANSKIICDNDKTYTTIQEMYSDA